MISTHILDLSNARNRMFFEFSYLEIYTKVIKREGYTENLYQLYDQYDRLGKDFKVIVIFDDVTPCGLLIGAELTDKIAVIKYLATSPTYRRRGLGDLLLKKFKEIISKDNAFIYIETDKAVSIGTIQFLQKHKIELLGVDYIRPMLCANDTVDDTRNLRCLTKEGIDNKAIAEFVDIYYKRVFNLSTEECDKLLYRMQLNKY